MNVNPLRESPTFIWMLNILDDQQEEPHTYLHRTRAGAIAHARKIIEENKELLDGMEPDESTENETDWSIFYENDNYWWQASVSRSEVLS